MRHRIRHPTIAERSAERIDVGDASSEITLPEIILVEAIGINVYFRDLMFFHLRLRPAGKSQDVVIAGDSEIDMVGETQPVVVVGGFRILVLGSVSDKILPDIGVGYDHVEIQGANALTGLGSGGIVGPVGIESRQRGVHVTHQGNSPPIYGYRIVLRNHRGVRDDLQIKILGQFLLQRNAQRMIFLLHVLTRPGNIRRARQAAVGQIERSIESVRAATPRGAEHSVSVPVAGEIRHRQWLVGQEPVRENRRGAGHPPSGSQVKLVGRNVVPLRVVIIGGTARVLGGAEGEHV